MAQVLAPKDQWYVVHVLSGQENKVRENLEKRVKKEEMSDVVFEVLVPTERVSEIKRGKKSETTRLISETRSVGTSTSKTTSLISSVLTRFSMFSRTLFSCPESTCTTYH